MTLRGEEVRFRSPHDALADGHRDDLPGPRARARGSAIWQNVFLGAELTRCALLACSTRRGCAREARALSGAARCDDRRHGRPVESLSGGQRQAVAISRALRWNAEIIIMDEPTAALGVKETAQVLDLIRQLKADGRTVILISHNMRDVVALAIRVVILSHGRKIVDRPVAGLERRRHQPHDHDRRCEREGGGAAMRA